MQRTRGHAGDVAADHDRDVGRADLFLADEADVRGLEHVVGGVKGGDEALRFEQTDGVGSVHVIFLGCDGVE